MKSLILMNPVRRRKSRRSRRVTTNRRRTVRRNPVVRSRRKVTIRRTRHHSAAMRRKISLAVKRANRNRVSHPSFTRTRALARRVGGGISRRFRRSSSGGGSLSLKTMFSRQVLATAGGAISASFLTSWLLKTYGAKLPGSGSMWGRVGYKLAIPFAGAYAVKKFAKQHDMANGMIIGGVVMAVNELISSWKQQSSAVAGASGYAGPADFGSQMINGMNDMPLEYAEDPDSVGEYFDAEPDPLYSNTPAFTGGFA